MHAADRWFVYVLACADGTLYTGIARDVATRLAQHTRGKGARYTRGRGPFVLRAVATSASHGDALRAERAVKALPRARKLAVSADDGALNTFVSRVAAKRLRAGKKQGKAAAPGAAQRPRRA